MTRGQTCSHFPPVCTQIQAHALCSAGVWLPLIGWVVDIHPHARSLNVVPVDHWERLVTMLSGRRLNMMRMSQAEVKYENRMENVSPASLLDRLSDYWWKLNWQFALSALTAVLLLWPKAHPVTLFLFLLRFSFHSLSLFASPFIFFVPLTLSSELPSLLCHWSSFVFEKFNNNPVQHKLFDNVSILTLFNLFSFVLYKKF